MRRTLALRHGDIKTAAQALPISSYDWVELVNGAWPDLSCLAKYDGRFKALRVRTNSVDWGSLAQLTKVQGFSYQAAGDIPDEADFSRWTSLIALRTGGTKTLPESLRRLEGLQYARLNDLAIRDFEGLSGWSGLRFLALISCTKLKDLRGVGALSRLTGLELNRCRALTDISELALLKNLVSLYVEKCKKIGDWSALDRLKSLRTLDLDGVSTVPSEEQILSLASLVHLAVNHAPTTSRLSRLREHPSLQGVDLDPCFDVSAEELRAQFKELGRRVLMISPYAPASYFPGAPQELGGIAAKYPE